MVGPTADPETEFWLSQACAKVAAGSQRALWRTRVGGRRDRQAWVLGRVQRPGKGGACGWTWACPGREWACPGAGTAICGGGTKRPELDPKGHRCEYRILAGVGVAAQAGRRWDAAGPGVRRRGLGLSAVGLPLGASRVSVVSRELGTLGQGKAGGSLRASRSLRRGRGRGRRSPGARHPEETRLSGGLELGRARTVHLKQR